MSSATNKVVKETIAQWATAESLSLLGIVALEGQLNESFARFQVWLAEGRHAEMAWLEKHLDCRKDPTCLLPGARSALLLALPYSQGDKLEIRPKEPRIAQYARFRDYHRILKERVGRVAAQMDRAWGGQSRVTVDTAPVLERALAERTELGFIGKNTCYIHPSLGSFLLLAEVFTTLSLEPDPKSPITPAERDCRGGCGPCDRCQRVCPTGALDANYRIDARLCLAYWTIEHRGTIPERFWPWLGSYYFGCDLCQLACPYNLKATGNRLPASLQERQFPPLFETATMSQGEYEKYFGGTPLTRAKREGLRRNALIAMAVTRHPRLQDALKSVRSDGTPVLEETVRQVARWISSCKETINN